MQKISKLSNKNKVIFFMALIALGILVQIGAIYIMNGILYGLDSLSNIATEYGEISDRLSTLEFRQITQVVLISPVLEEAIFRFVFIGLIMRLLKDLKIFSIKDFNRTCNTKKCKDAKNSNSSDGINSSAKNSGIFWCVNVLSSLLFGIYHWNIVQFTYAFILGLMLGFIFYEMGGYVSSLIVHMVINAAGLYVAPLLPDSLSSVAMIILGIAVMAVAFVVLLFDYRLTEKSCRYK